MMTILFVLQNLYGIQQSQNNKCCSWQQWAGLPGPFSLKALVTACLSSAGISVAVEPPVSPGTSALLQKRPRHIFHAISDQLSIHSPALTITT